MSTVLFSMPWSLFGVYLFSAEQPDAGRAAQALPGPDRPPFFAVSPPQLLVQAPDDRTAIFGGARYTRSSGSEMALCYQYQRASDVTDEAFYGHSADHGRTWSEPTSIYKRDPHTDDLAMAGMTVPSGPFISGNRNPFTGEVIVFSDTRERPAEADPDLPPTYWAQSSLTYAVSRDDGTGDLFRYRIACEVNMDPAARGRGRTMNKFELTPDHLAAANRPRRIVVNYDIWAFCCDAAKAETHAAATLDRLGQPYLQWRDDEGNQLDSLWYCFGEGNTAHWPSRVLPVWKQYRPWFEAGLDPYTRLIAGNYSPFVISP